MKEIVPSPPPIVRNDVAAVQALFNQNVVPSYGRFDIVLSHGSGSYLYDVIGKRYLDLGGGIAVSCLGHAHPAITEVSITTSPRGDWRRPWSGCWHRASAFFATVGGRLMKVCLSSLANSATKKVDLRSFQPRILSTAEPWRGFRQPGKTRLKKGSSQWLTVFDKYPITTWKQFGRRSRLPRRPCWWKAYRVKAV